jgi:hypothetical protein
MSLVDELLFAFYFAILLVNMIDVSSSPWQNNVTPEDRYFFYQELFLVDDIDLK